MELKKKAAGVGAGILAAAGIVYVKSKSAEGLKFETFESKEGRFTVSMPPGPDEVLENIEKDEWEIPVTMFVADSTELGFVVGYSDYSQELIETSEPMENLGWIIEGIVDEVKGKLVREKVLELGTVAKEYQVEIPEKGVMTSRLILDGQRLYQLIAMFPEDGYDKVKEAEFFDSFEISKD